MVKHTLESLHQLYRDRPSARDLPSFITQDFLHVIKADLEDCRLAFAEDAEDPPVDLSVELVTYPGFAVGIYPTPEDGYIVVVPAGLLIRTVAFSRRLFSYRNAPSMRIPQWAKERHQVSSMPPSGFAAIFSDKPSLSVLRFAAEEFDAETLKNADDDAGFDEQAEAGAADCARQALDFVIQHEIAHARLGHRQVRRSIPELTSTAKRMLARGYEVQAYVVAAAYSMRLMFKNAQENGWTEPDLFNRIAYWSGFSHTLALGVLDARNLYGPSALEEVLHPHPHVRQEFIYRAALAELARSDLASLYGESAPEQLARFASRYLSGLNLAVNSAFWACCVISGLHETDLYPAFALRKTADWKLNKMGHDYSCLVIAEVDSRVFQSPTTYYCFLDALVHRRIQ